MHSHILSGRRAFAGALLPLLSLSAIVAVRADSSPNGPVEHLPTLTVTAPAPISDQYQLPQVVQTISAPQIADTVNAVDVEDSVKYLPSLFVRKRNYGDNQPVLATRTWGSGSSARSLIYADGVLLSALIANNNTVGAPRWGMVAPAEIDHIDVLYGPFAAAYPGNSIGAVMEISTRMPNGREASLVETAAFQPFSLYGTKHTYGTSETSAIAGDRIGRWSFWVSGSDEHTQTQPLLFVTAGSLPAGTSGGISAGNKLGQAADVLGASGILDANYVNAKAKVAYDFTPTLRATYTFGLWTNDSHSSVQTYLRDAGGAPTFAGVAGFASGTYRWIEEHTMQSLVLRSTGASDWDWQAIASLYDFDKDTQQIAGAAASSGTSLSTSGKVALLGGTGWSTLDLKAAWHPDGRDGSQELSFGVHGDTYKLVNPTYSTPDWRAGTALSSLSTEGNGDTETGALWAQDAWKFSQEWKAIVGARLEAWEALNGVNVNGSTTVLQPRENSEGFSPKATLAWSPDSAWTYTASVGRAIRFPTAAELYQLISTGSTFTSPSPNLAPERVWSGELRADRRFDHGSWRVSLFQENTNDAVISQFNPLVPGSSTQFQFISNVGRVRNRGIEVVADREDVLIHGLELTGSATYVDSQILSDSGRGQFGSAIGKHAPNVPNWRASFVATYRPKADLAFTVAGRYSGRQYSTLDNTDVNPDVYGGFDDFFVLDTRVKWNLAPRWTLAAGVDNLLNRKYFLFHPFPQRTFVGELKFAL